MTSGLTEDSLAKQQEITADQKKFLHQVLSYYKDFAAEKADDERSRKRTAAAAFRVFLIENRLELKGDGEQALRMARDEYAALAATSRGARIPRIPWPLHFRLGRVPGTPETLAVQPCATLSNSRETERRVPRLAGLPLGRGALSVEPVQAPLRVTASTGRPRNSTISRGSFRKAWPRNTTRNREIPSESGHQRLCLW